MRLTISISTPLLIVYLLRELNLNYLMYMVVTLFGVGISLFVIGVWGKIADKYGNYKVLKITSIILPITPILWILSPNILYLIFVPSLIGGIGRGNEFAEYQCAFTLKEYTKPIEIDGTGEFTILAVAIDKNMKIVDKNIFSYRIRSDVMFFSINISPDHEAELKWPACTNFDGDYFSVQDLIPENCTLGVAVDDGPIREYSHELLKTYQSLNFSLIPGTTYRFKLIGTGTRKIGIEGRPWQFVKTKQNSPKE